MEIASYYSLLKAIFSGVWLIEEQSAIGFLPELARILNGENPSFQFPEAKGEPSAILGVGPASNTIRYERSFDDFPEGSVSVVHLSGVLMKNDQWCGPEGTASIMKRLQNADRSTKIVAHVLHTDSPGGTVDGTETAHRIMSELKKPVVVFADGMMASAAYWIGSPASHIMAAGKSTIIGSIGTMLSIANMKPAFEKLGVEFHTVRASKSTEKNKLIDDVLEGKYDPVKKEVLDPLNELFHSAIKSNRSQITDQEVFTGKTYLAENALQMGLIDSIGTFEQAVEKARELGTGSGNSSETNHSVNTQTNNDMKFKSKWAAVLTFLGLSSEQLENEEEAPVVTEEHLEKLNSELESQNKTLESLKALFEEKAKEGAFDLVQSVKELATENSDLQKENKELKEKAQIATTPPKTKTDELDDGEDPMAVLDEMPHNKAADEVMGYLNVDEKK